MSERARARESESRGMKLQSKSVIEVAIVQFASSRDAIAMHLRSHGVGDYINGKEMKRDGETQEGKSTK